MWVGIDGYGGTTVEQDGTDSDCLDGAPSYHAWIEMYGDDADTQLDDGSSVSLPNAVFAGDSMSATVIYASGGWTLTVSDQTPGHSWNSSTTTTWDPDSSASPSEASAEWVVERPELCTNNSDCNLASLANFGTAAFSSASATDNGTPESLSALGAFPLQMDSGSASSTLLALPGPLSTAGGFAGFSDTFYASN